MFPELASTTHIDLDIGASAEYCPLTLRAYRLYTKEENKKLLVILKNEAGKQCNVHCGDGGWTKVVRNDLRGKVFNEYLKEQA